MKLSDFEIMVYTSFLDDMLKSEEGRKLIKRYYSKINYQERRQYRINWQKKYQQEKKKHETKN